MAPIHMPKMLLIISYANEHFLLLNNSKKFTYLFIFLSFWAHLLGVKFQCHRKLLSFFHQRQLFLSVVTLEIRIKLAIYSSGIKLLSNNSEIGGKKQDVPVREDTVDNYLTVCFDNLSIIGFFNKK